MAEFFNRSERNDKQEAALQRLRDYFLPKYLSNPIDVEEYQEFLTDETFIRYLKARNWIVEKALAMLEETVKWRKEFEVNALISGKWIEHIKTENAPGKLYVRGMDKKGHVLVYMKPRHENSRDHDNNVRHLVYNLERAIAFQKYSQSLEDADTNPSNSSSAVSPVHTEENSFRPNKICLVVDYHGFTLANSPPLKTSLAVLSILQNHYPERLHRAYLIRTPWVFGASFKMISPFIDPVSRAKIVFMKSTDLKQIRLQLSEDIDVSVLESEIGGDDAVPFASAVYMNAPFQLDYMMALRESHTDVSTIAKDVSDLNIATEVEEQLYTGEDLMVSEAAATTVESSAVAEAVSTSGN